MLRHQMAKSCMQLFVILFCCLLELPLRCGSAGKESAYNVGYLGLIPVLGRHIGEGKGYPLQ